MSAWPSLSVRDPGDPAFLSAFRRLVERAHTTDGHSAFNDSTLTHLTDRTVRGVDHGNTLAAAVVDSGLGVEFAVDPAHRRLGIGGAIVRQLLAENAGQVTAWAHGNHPAAQVLAARFGFQPFRTLLQLRARVPIEVGAWSREDSTLTCFRPGVDDEEWLALHSRVFAGHPEQSRFSWEELQARLRSHWFDPEDFLLARDLAGRLIGYCWLKVAPDAGRGESLGEVYILGVDPAHSGEGLGRELMRAGLTRLHLRGIRTVFLYVEADNSAALNLYRSLEFTDHSADVQYRSMATVS